MLAMKTNMKTQMRAIAYPGNRDEDVGGKGEDEEEDDTADGVDDDLELSLVAAAGFDGEGGGRLAEGPPHDVPKGVHSK